ncbi:hypothetical protein LTS08_006283 [Lithohypha guttulata]|nr:hypothetical protein LTS08_006283 [Lithohypha guttulata]
MARPNNAAVDFKSLATVTSDTWRHSISEADLKKLGALKRFVLKKAESNLQHGEQALLTSRTGQRYDFDNPEGIANVFDKLEDFISGVFSFLDHETRLSFSRTNSLIFAASQKAVCYISERKSAPGPWGTYAVKTWKYQLVNEDQKLGLVARSLHTDFQSVSVVQVLDDEKHEGSDRVGRGKTVGKSRHNQLGLEMLVKLVEVEERLQLHARQVFQKKFDLLRKEYLRRLRAAKDQGRQVRVDIDSIQTVSPSVRGPSKGIRIVEFVRLHCLTVDLIQMTGLRELKELQGIAIYSCFHFGINGIHQKLGMINVALQKVHKCVIPVDWCFALPLNGVKNVVLPVAMVGILYRGAKKEFSSAYEEPEENTHLMHIMDSRNDFIGYTDEQLRTRKDYNTFAEDCRQCFYSNLDMDCLTVWLAFSKGLFETKSINAARFDPTLCQPSVLFRKVCTMIHIQNGLLEPFPQWEDWLGYLRKTPNLKDESIRLLPNTVAMRRLFGVATRMQWTDTRGSGLPHTHRFNRTRACQKCDHDAIPVLFFSRAAQGQKEGEFTCLPCQFFDGEGAMGTYGQALTDMNEAIKTATSTYEAVDCLRNLQVITLAPEQTFKSLEASLKLDGNEVLRVVLADEEAKRVVGDMSRMCPDRLLGKACSIRGQTCKMGIPSTFRAWDNLPGGRVFNKARLHPRIAAICSNNINGNACDNPCSTPNHAVIHEVQIKSKFLPLYQAACAEGRRHAHKFGKLNPPFLAPVKFVEPTFTK